MTDRDHILIDNGSRQLTLDELGMTQPGMGRIMPDVGTRMWKTYYAAKAENWPLARFELSEAVNLLELGAFVRPKYQENMESFIRDDLDPVRKAIEIKNWLSFKLAFERMVECANAFHELYEKGFIRWRIPDSAPPDLDMATR